MAFSGKVTLTMRLQGIQEPSLQAATFDAAGRDAVRAVILARTFAKEAAYK